MDFMRLKDISPDAVVFWQWGWLSLNGTIVFTWAVMGLLVLIALLGTINLTSETRFSRWQNLLEVLIDGMRGQIAEISGENPRRYLPFVGTLFLFIALSNILTVIPGFVAPTASLSTTAALAILVFVAVPAYGIMDQGLRDYLRHYIRPTPLMLPFHVMGELSRTLALAVRLFGNIMSGTKIAAVLLVVMPLVFPVIMQILGLLTGLIQAYIFAVLAMVYIASGTQAIQERQQEPAATSEEESSQES